jgi:hypothetical protein
MIEVLAFIKLYHTTIYFIGICISIFGTYLWDEITGEFGIKQGNDPALNCLLVILVSALWPLILMLLIVFGAGWVLHKTLLYTTRSLVVAFQTKEKG